MATRDKKESPQVWQYRLARLKVSSRTIIGSKTGSGSQFGDCSSSGSFDCLPHSFPELQRTYLLGPPGCSRPTSSQKMEQGSNPPVWDMGYKNCRRLQLAQLVWIGETRGFPFSPKTQGSNPTNKVPPSHGRRSHKNKQRFGLHWSQGSHCHWS